MKKTIRIIVSSIIIVSVLITSQYDIKGVNGAVQEHTTSGETLRFDASIGAIRGYTGSPNKIVIPDSINGVSVVSITEYAFYNCSSLTSITLPDSIVLSGNEFTSCINLEEINVSESNMNYSSEDGILFDKNKTKLIIFPRQKTNKSYTIPNSVSTINKFAFLNCLDLISITIPESVTYIGDYAFSQCRDLTDIKIPNSVTYIGSYAFSECSSIKTIFIPKNVSYIGKAAFELCRELREINVEQSNLYYLSEEGVLFNKNKTELLAYSASKSSQSYTIPESVKSIGNSAFTLSRNLVSVITPKNVKYIGDYAFLSGINLKSIYFFGDAPIMGKEVFYNVHKNFIVFYLPDKVGFLNPWNKCHTAIFDEKTIATLPSSNNLKKTKIILKTNNSLMDVNGKVIEIDSGRKTSPIIINGRTLVPIRAIIESLGGTVNWEETNRKIILTLDNKKIELWIGNPKMKIDGFESYIDYKKGTIPEIINGRTMIPIRAIIEEFGGMVEWDENTSSVIISY